MSQFVQGTFYFLGAAPPGSVVPWGCFTNGLFTLNINELSFKVIRI